MCHHPVILMSDMTRIPLTSDQEPRLPLSGPRLPSPPRGGEINDFRQGGREGVIGLGSCHANRRYRVRGEAVSCGEPRPWRRGMLGRSGQMNLGMDHN